MEDKYNIYTIIALFILSAMLIMMSLIAGAYGDALDKAQIYIKEWQNNCDSLRKKNCELHMKVYELQDSIITLKYKED